MNRKHGRLLQPEEEPQWYPILMIFYIASTRAFKLVCWSKLLPTDLNPWLYDLTWGSSLTKF